jgi:hypothetical protein
MLVLTTYPKSSSRSCMNFAESQIYVFHISFFSSKHYSSKVYTRFGKVVVLVTQSTTKLGLQFWIFL